MSLYRMTTEKPRLRDAILYDKIKNEISAKNEKSTYRSGLIVKKYKNEYMQNMINIMHILEKNQN